MLGGRGGTDSETMTDTVNVNGKDLHKSTTMIHKIRKG